MEQHCCETMTHYVNFKCKQHPNIFDCPDSLIHYTENLDEYGLIIHDGGTSVLTIYYCPWCGNKLPESKRDLWFETLYKLVFDDPTEQRIPDEFLTEKWYKIKE
ncbi:DUF6980 family protein [Cytobacillus sp. IB215316]|uniref:DUF6980 family protein n=1 Tax=Cytobacillus sp. IB215316 TaxID=3097354 RepID=UPI002A0CFA21|nr:hypothetical protein [Cytobacillus sp. IB215316]MDX8361787.1 hypothetical protein [Cytobacillus sp. IB215316]